MLAQTPSLWLILIAFVCMLGPLVFFHELGHYLVARWFKVPAETFSIGFGHEILGWTDRRGTRWKVGWLPLGGFVKFVGDMNPASVPSPAEDVPEDLRDRAFQFRPVWQRFLIVLAGPIANFILAIAIFTVFFAAFGAPMDNVVGAIKPNTAAAAAGIRPGDRILAVAGRDTPTFTDLTNVVAVRPNEIVTVKIERQQSVREIRVRLKFEDTPDAYGHKFRRGLLGVYPKADALRRVSPWRAIPEATSYTFRLTRATVDGLLQIIRGRISPKEIGGPIAVAKVAGEGASLGPLPFVQLVALLSINLGFINLL